MYIPLAGWHGSASAGRARSSCAAAQRQRVPGRAHAVTGRAAMAAATEQDCCCYSNPSNHAWGQAADATPRSWTWQPAPRVCGSNSQQK